MQRRILLALSAVAMLAARTIAATRGGTVRTRVETDADSFVIEVDPDVAPVTVAHYLAHVDGKLLDGGAVYRIVTLANQGPETRHKIQVVQWGMNRPEDQPPPLPAISHETTQQTGLRHLDGTVSMARAQPAIGTVEYFICIGAQPELDFGGGRNPDGPRLRPSAPAGDKEARGVIDRVIVTQGPILYNLHASSRSSTFGLSRQRSSHSCATSPG